MRSRGGEGRRNVFVRSPRRFAMSRMLRTTPLLYNSTGGTGLNIQVIALPEQTCMDLTATPRSSDVLSTPNLTAAISEAADT